MAGRERANTNRLHDSLEEEEGRRDGLIGKLQGFWRAKDNFDRRMEDLGVRGDEGMICHVRYQIIVVQIRVPRGGYRGGQISGGR